MKKNLVVIEELKKQGKALLDARTLSDKVFCQMNF